jgi:phosphatidylglycerophosphatase A
MDRLIMAVATGLYSGTMPAAPGTWGSAFALLPWYFCRGLSLGNYLIVLAGIFVVGFLTAGSAEKLLDTPDAGCIVIDEIMGMFVTLTLAPNHPLAWILGFLLFRLFDIAKPFPVSWFDSHMHGGLGIMMDDVMAGIYALICLQLIWLVVGRLL